MEMSPSKTMKAVESTMDWSSVLAGLVLAGTGAIIAVVGGLKDLILAWIMRWTKSARDSMSSQIGKMANFLEAIEAVREVENVDRVFVFRGKNGGGRPTPGKVYTVKAVHGWAKDKHKDPLSRYNFEIPVDAHYCRLLESMIKDGVTEVTTQGIPPEAKLKTYYMTEGVIQSRMYFLKIMGDELLYISIATYSHDFTDNEKIEMDLAVNRVAASLTSNGDN